ncbi:SDR family NAD(P)-dependent oxidoreductase [Streptomyces sp. NPDC050625]|uniref:SDR family NAD(P)-dependent oxidoreductase n=1 Tax=Streptomyces sp. NPDC050625 TaxID=3154629 RepID=UPI003412DB82
MGMLSGRVIAITGAGGGIGREIAKLCAAEGARIVASDIGASLDGTEVTGGPAFDLVKEIEAVGGEAVAHTDDISEIEGGESLLATGLDAFGNVDVLVNCAGILRDKMIFNMTAEEWDAVIKVHLRGHFSTIRPLTAYWRKQGNPDANNRVINFTSAAGLFGNVGQPNYAAAKMGVIGLTYSLANGLTKYGVTSNAISPGAATRMTASVPKERLLYSEDGDERSPRHVAPIVAYVASERSRWLNGQVIDSRGYTLTLFNKPEPKRQIIGTGPWDLERMAALVEDTFRAAV